MYEFYKLDREDFVVHKGHNSHRTPHLHSYLECVYSLEGEVALGQGTELFLMEEGDFAIVFPNTLHHYQVFNPENSRSMYLLTAPEDAGVFTDLILNQLPKNPVIKSEDVDPEIKHALGMISKAKDGQYRTELCRGYLQIILAKYLEIVELGDRKNLEGEDLVYRIVSYISANFQGDVSLTEMARELGVSQYTLSRTFSSVFHTNFNTYVNEIRLDYATGLLKYTERPITEVAMTAGFPSLRTFNRVCLEKLRMSPREYRKNLRGEAQMREAIVAEGQVVVK